MTHPKLVSSDNPILRKKCRKVLFNTDISETLAIMNDVFDTTPTAVGLAAPQIGLDMRLFMINYNGRRVFINPQIIEKSGLTQLGLEGCLSLPAQSIYVVRNEKVLVSFYDENWHKFEETFDQFFARIIQHEYDHLNGKLITDYLNVK